jgi:hypothetical protein
VLPLVALLHVEHATLVGHLLYGTMLGGIRSMCIG